MTLDVGTSGGQGGLEAAVRDELSQIYRSLQERLNPKLMAAAFLVENLPERIEAAQPETAKGAAKIRRLLSEAFDEMHLFLAPVLGDPQSHEATDQCADARPTDRASNQAGQRSKHNQRAGYREHE